MNTDPQIMTLGQIRAQCETYLMNTSTDVNSLSWSEAELNGYINEACFYTQQVTEYLEEFQNIVCTASVSTYTGGKSVYKYQRITWDRDFLPQTNEYELDRDDPSWRLASPNISPYRFYFPQMGQQFQLVPYPTPSQDGISYVASEETGVVCNFLVAGALPGGLTLTSEFEEVFENDAVGPLNPVNWSQDVSGNYPNSLAVIANTGPGILGNVCVTGPNSVNPFWQAQEYWTGNAPGNGFVQATIGYLAAGASVFLGYRAVLPNNNSRVPGGGYAASITGPTGSSGAASILVQCINPSITFPLILTGLTISAGDTITIVYIGTAHYVLQNGVQIGSFTDGTHLNGGVNTASLGVVAVSANTDVQILAFETGSASIATGAALADSSYTFNQETGIVIGVADTNGSIIIFRPDTIANPFVPTNNTNASSPDLGELQIYSTDELNIGTCFTRIPDTMVLDTDVPQLPSMCHFPLAMYAVMKCFVREGEFQDLKLAQGWFQAYGDWMESVLENKGRWWATRVRSLEPFESGSLFAKRLNAIGYPMQIDLQPSYGSTP